MRVNLVPGMIAGRQDRSAAGSAADSGQLRLK